MTIHERVGLCGRDLIRAKRGNHWVMVGAALFLALAPVLTRAAPQEEEFVIEEYDFLWTVAKSGEASLIMRKTHETTRVVIRSGGIMGDSLYVLPADAEAIGKALTDVDEYFERMRNSEDDVTEQVDAGNYRVAFRFSRQHGFSVWIRSTERFSMTSLSLDRSQAKGLAPHLQKAEAMAAFVDKKVQF